MSLQLTAAFSCSSRQSAQQQSHTASPQAHHAGTKEGRGLGKEERREEDEITWKKENLNWWKGKMEGEGMKEADKRSNKK